MTDLERATSTARRLVLERFPEATAAWLAGSVVLGGATATSDLDITVVRPSGGAFRESLTHDGWPVELFVHTPASVRHFVGKDQERRRPTMARLVASGRPLLDGDASAAALVAECVAVLAAGPPPLTDAERDLRRYGLTDQLDDLAGGGPPALVAAVAVGVWHESAELLLASKRHWSGSGKWLVRELEAYDAASGTAYASRLDAGLRAALAGDPSLLVEVADDVLAGTGGRLWAGYRAEADEPAADQGLSRVRPT